MIRRRALLLVPAAALSAGSAAAQGQPVTSVPPEDAAAIQRTIRGQLDAFARDDAPAAYALAAPNIHAMFPNADTFLSMVRRAYPQVYRPRQSEFSTLERRNGIVVQEVELVGPDNQPVIAAYTMERDAAGTWRITGCSLLPSVRATT